MNNIIVAGEAYPDFMTLNYDLDGNLLWGTLYDGPANNQDRANDAVLDSHGHVLVTGQSWGTTAPADGTQWNFATVKFDAATGDTLWTRRYNGPARDVPTDLAFAVTVDDDDNVYVAGWSDGTAERPQCLTIKYGPDGDELWQRRYPTGGSAGFACYDVLHDRGAVYVAARGAGDVLLKYAADGTLLWSAAYATEIGFATSRPHLAADAEGNVYMTSLATETDPQGGVRTDYVVLKYTPSGARVWTYVYPGTGPAGRPNLAHAITTDAEGHVYVTGEGGGDFLTLKLSQTPTSGAPEPTAAGFVLSPGHPNPLRATTTIPYALPSAGHVRLVVHDVLGRLVAVLVDGPQAAGTHEATFDASALPSGVYVYRMESGAFSQTRWLTLIR